MSDELIGLLSFILVFILLLARVPIIASMLFCGLLGYILIDGWNVSINTFSVILFRGIYAYSLTVVPLFVLIGNFAIHTGFAADAFKALRYWVGKLPGGLAIATIFANTLFAAISGAGIAAAAVFTKVAVPEMKKAGYDLRLATGTCAGAAPLAAMIPPSVVMVIYAMLSEADLRKLLIAGIIPGIMISILLVVALLIVTLLRPNWTPKETLKVSWKVRFVSIGSVWPLIFIAVFILGTIYLGIATPTEAGALGTFMALVLGLALRKLGWQAIRESLLDAATISGAILGIYLGAKMFSQMLTISGLPQMIVSIVMAMHLPAMIVIIMFMVIYIILGCFMDAITMMYLTIGTMVPILKAFDVDLVWFGIMVVSMVELGAITPPFGVNLFAVKASLPKDVNISLGGIVQGSLPYMFVYPVALALIMAFPAIALYLPNMMK